MDEKVGFSKKNKSYTQTLILSLLHKQTKNRKKQQVNRYCFLVFIYLPFSLNFVEKKLKYKKFVTASITRSFILYLLRKTTRYINFVFF